MWRRVTRIELSTCRERGWDAFRERLSTLLRTRQTRVIDPRYVREELLEYVVRVKCMADVLR